MQTNQTITISRNSRAVETTVGAETVVMMIETGECIGLGDTGSEVWRQLAMPTSAPALMERLRDLYEAPDGVIEQDVQRLIEDLEAHHLILVE